MIAAVLGVFVPLCLCVSFHTIRNMLDLAYLRENIETARERLAHRGFSLDVETFLHLDGERKRLIQDVERLRQLVLGRTR